MYEDNLEIYLKPYGVVTHSVDVSDLNIDVAEKVFFRCGYGNKKSTTKKSKKSKNTNENPGLVLLVVFGIIAYIIKKYLDSKKSKTSSNISSSSLNIDTKKVDQNTFETLGKSTRSFFKNPSDRVQNIFLIIIIIVIFGLLMTYCSDGSDGPPRFFGEVR